MKKWLLPILCSCMLCLSSCSLRQQTVAYIGLNAEIVDVSRSPKGFIVKSLDADSILGAQCFIACDSLTVDYLYANEHTSEVTFLEYPDFMVGDQITVDVGAVQDGYAAASRVQLLTQRWDMKR